MNDLLYELFTFSLLFIPFALAYIAYRAADVVLNWMVITQ